MALYRAQEIKDRVAQGDDLYQITDTDGKKKLTPSPTAVSEPGTEINKALLQPLVDAVERIDEDVDPYRLYWWWQRTTADSYSVSLATATGGEAINYVIGSTFVHDEWWYMLVERASGTNVTSCTVQYSSSISVNQTNGAITLVSPTTLIVSTDNIDSVKSSNPFAGKYVKGLYPSPNTIYYIPDNSIVFTKSYTDSSGTTYYTGFFTSDYTYYGETDVKMPVAAKATALGDWELISSANSDQHPHSGTQNGMEYQYVGKVIDSALGPSVPNLQTVNITSASYSSDNKFAINIPGKVCWFRLTASNQTSKATEGFICVDKNHVLWHQYTGTTYDQTTIYVGSVSGDFAKFANGQLLFGTGNGLTANQAATVHLIQIS